MVNYCDFKSAIVLKEIPLVKDDKTVKVSAIPKGNGTNAKKQLVKNSILMTKHGVQYLMLTCPTVLIQALNNMCLDTEMVCLYKHFILHRSIIL